MSGHPKLKEFETDELVAFSKHSGIAVRLEPSRILIFSRIKRRWSVKEVSRADIREIVEIVTTADQREAEGTAQIIAGIYNMMSSARAARATGVEIRLRLLDTPTLFVSFPDKKQREIVYEALRQLIDTGSLNGAYRDIPRSVRRQLER